MMCYRISGGKENKKMTTAIQPVEDIAINAHVQYRLARSLKHRGYYGTALEYFKRAARSYESLANREDIPADKRQGYLERQRECLESMLVDAFIFNLPLWVNIMLKIKEIDGYSCSIN